MSAAPLSLFEGYGIEIECTIVRRDTLDVLPIADELLRAIAGTEDYVEDVEEGAIGLSNELVTHLIELKTNGPVRGFDGLAEHFRARQLEIEAVLGERWGARLMPTGMHPWMDPARETRIWPHEHGPIYRAYDRLFDCRRHGWANLQSVHLNLPFADQHEFERLMAAVRLVLPLIPALAASSPIVEGRATGQLDARLEVYRTNSDRVVSMTGEVIPEPVYAIDEYRQCVLGAITLELEARGADPVLLGQEWTNARGAIARFDRMAIEIRLIDTQECARADLAVAAAVAGLVRGLVEERTSSLSEQRAWPSAALVELLGRTIATGPETELAADGFAGLLGHPGASTAAELLRAAVPETFAGPPELEEHARLVLERGTLAQRILAAVGDDLDRGRLRAVYAELCDCLESGSAFRP